ncbi:MAG: RNA polymerase sigma-70 factor [Dysgonamonadaceae bacterium]|jgi:RNA polymerase sigma-70 factor (ECF subfamily)|nr:RNA polymerase sigma-70 factor [Dysgonamonadaceae bacterium]
MEKKNCIMIEPVGIDLSDMQEFQDFFERYYTPLCVFAIQYIGNEAIANDIVQDCFVKLWKQRNQILYVHQAKSFIYTSVKNRSLNELSHSQVVQNYAAKVQEKATESYFSDKVIEEETYRILTDAIDKLPKRMREIMLLALDGKSNPEIAKTLSVSVENVHTLKKKAYVKLRTSLKDYYYILFLFL